MKRKENIFIEKNYIWDNAFNSELLSLREALKGCITWDRLDTMIMCLLVNGSIIHVEKAI